MVKIRIRYLVLSFIILIFMASVAYAQTTHLSFSDVDVKVGSKTSKNLRNGDTINDEAEPGDTVEFRIEVKSNFTSAEDVEIEDVTVDATIEELDDGDDVDEESSEFDLDAGDDKRVTLKFQVPIEVDEDTFNVEINAEGDTDNNGTQKVTMKLKLEVEKESHLLKVIKKTLSPAEVSCNRKNVQLSTSLLNIGSEDEEDINFQVSSTDLGIDLKDSISELRAEPNEPESKFLKTYSFKVPDELEAGSYPITLSALYDDDRKKAEDSVALSVSDCPTAKKETKSQEQTTKTSEESEEVEVVTPTTGRTTATVVQPTAPAGTTVTEESFLKSNAFVVGIIIAEVVAVIVGIVLVISLFRRKG
ncbi:hypothetical protein HYX00_05425 [Candidatus Woesearchaeota archaeon]|nr:hypothetical protein [Candidatus Woesearchaeota archaeon]